MYKSVEIGIQLSSWKWTRIDIGNHIHAYIMFNKPYPFNLGLSINGAETKIDLIFLTIIISYFNPRRK